MMIKTIIVNGSNPNPRPPITPVTKTATAWPNTIHNPIRHPDAGTLNPIPPAAAIITGKRMEK
jgi:hypothetical protein